MARESSEWSVHCLRITSLKVFEGIGRCLPVCLGNKAFNPKTKERNYMYIAIVYSVSNVNIYQWATRKRSGSFLQHSPAFSPSTKTTRNTHARGDTRFKGNGAVP